MKLSKIKTEFEEKRKRDDRPGIPDTVKLVVNTEVFEISGFILVYYSPVVFLDLISKQSELYLDEFTGCTEELQDCIVLLNGAEVEMRLEKLQVFMKFAILYGVKEILDLSVEWTKENICVENVKAIMKISFALLNECEEKDPDNIYRDELGDECVEFITTNCGDSLYAALDLPTDPEDNSDFDIVAFILYCDAIYDSHSVLVPITSWINSSAKADHILEEIETHDDPYGDFDLGVQKDVIIAFLGKLTLHVESVESLKLLNKLQIHILKTEYCGAIGYGVRMLLTKAKEWLKFDEKQIKCVQKRFKMEKFQYGEIILDWIRTKKPSQKVVYELWEGLFTPCEEVYGLSGLLLPLEYVQSLRHAIIETHNYEIPVPKVSEEITEEDTFTDGCSPNSSQNGDIIKTCLTDPEAEHAVELLGACRFKGFNCEKETKRCRTLRLVDSTPSFDLLLEDRLDTDTYHHHHLRIHHWYFTTRKDGKDVLFSLVTNTFDEVMEMLRNVNEGDCLNCHFLESIYNFNRDY